MKRGNALVIAAFMLCIVVIGFTFLDFLALHDIRRDYVSQSILDHLKVDVQAGLPDWTATPGEWSLVTISYVLRVVFLIINFVALSFWIKKMKTRSNARP